MCDGRDIYFNKLGDVGKQLSLLGTYKIGGIIPIQIIPILIFVIVVWIIVEKTVFRKINSGCREIIFKSSALAGIDFSAVMMAVSGFSGFCAGFAGDISGGKGFGHGRKFTWSTGRTGRYCGCCYRRNAYEWGKSSCNRNTDRRSDHADDYTHLCYE